MDEPFDEIMGPKTSQRHQIQQKMGDMDQATPLISSPPTASPPASSFTHTSTSVAPPSNAFSHRIPGRWNQYENDFETKRAESNLASARALAGRRFSDNPESLLEVSHGQSHDKSHPQQNPIPRPTYQFRRSESDGTGSSLVSSGFRHYGWRDDPDQDSNLKIRDDALKVLDMVDSKLKTQYQVERTESGSFRTLQEERGSIDENSNNVVDPYCVRRTASGTISSGVGESKRRVPAALSGLDFGTKRPTSRVTFREPNFMDDESPCQDEEDVIIEADISEDEMEMRATSNAPAKSTWSSRYTVDSTLMAMSGGLSGREILEDIERENRRQRMSARNMLASSAYTLKSKVAEGKGKVFGSGFTFRQNNVFGKSPADDIHGTNLHGLQDDDADSTSVIPPPPPLHKTWQQALLNKQKRQRIILACILALSGLIAVLLTSVRVRRSDFNVKTVESPAGEGVTFYVTSDVPFDAAQESKLAKDLEQLPGDAEFVVHLGNIQDASTSFCPKTTYGDVASMLQKSPVPMLVLPGEHDWIRCPEPEVALEEWILQFGSFESNFASTMLLRRQRDRVENFSMLHKGVLFMGLHLVSGPIENQDEWDAILEDNLKFFFGMLNLNKDQFRAIVIFGNARPGPQQDPFFQGVVETVENLRLPVAYVHANPGTGAVEEYVPFEAHESILGVQIEDGGRNPPLRVKVGFGSRPFVLG